MRTRNVLLSLLLLSVLLAGGVSYYASSSPDGLEKVAIDHGIAGQAREHDLAASPLADYGVAGVDDARLSVGLAGVLGLAATFALASTLVLVVRRRDHQSAM
jgi:PDGLE domain